MQQGDQYAIRINIQNGGVAVTPSDVTGVKVALGSIVHVYPGDLSYDSEGGSWLFPVSQRDTLALQGRVPAQVQLNYGGDPAQIIGSKVKQVVVDASMITEVWDD